MDENREKTVLLIVEGRKMEVRAHHLLIARHTKQELATLIVDSMSRGEPVEKQKPELPVIVFPKEIIPYDKDLRKRKPAKKGRCKFFRRIR